MSEGQKLKVSYKKDYFDSDNTSNTFVNSLHQCVINLENSHLNRRPQRLIHKKPQIQQIVFRNKVKRLTENFIRKLKLNSIYREPIQNLQDHKVIKEAHSNKFLAKIENIRKNISQKRGISLANFILIVWSLIIILQTTIMVFIFSIMLAFRQTQTVSLFIYMRIASFGIYIIDMILNFTSQRNENGKKLQYIGQISEYYLQNGFIGDIISILVFPVDMAISKNITVFLSFIYLMKLYSSIQKFQRFEYLIFTSTQREQYFGLLKVFLTNFAIAHFLSIVLNLMAGIDSGENWRLKMHIENAEWQIKYIWGYYWGTNIMLTVGFGDITATNYYQAIVLVFIQTVSCITLAYNISYVGALIASIRNNQQKKKQKLKTFHRMCKQNQVSNQIQCKISNYIEEAYEIKQNFQYEAHDEVMDFLPKNLQKQYRIQANKILFDSLGFLNNLSKKTLLKLAEQVNRRICHPQQIILRKGETPDFIILQKGSLAFTCKNGSNLDGKTIELLQAEGKLSKPKMFSLDFIKNKAITFNTKSLDYSVIYYLSREDFMQILKNSEMDYQFLCVLRDREEIVIDENNLYLCEICKDKYHNKFQCSRLHYMPLKQNIINKYIYSGNYKFMPQKNFFHPNQSGRMKCLINKKVIQEDGQKFIKDNTDEEELREAQKLRHLLESISQSSTQSEIARIFKTQIVHTLRDLLGMEKPKRWNTTYIKNIVEQKALYKLEELFQANKEQYKFWEVQIDQMHDFRYYFKQSNPENLLKNKKSFKKWKFSF